MSKKKCRAYDKEFKLNAVALYQSTERSYKQVADELGIPQATLVGWVANHENEGAQAFPGKGHLKPADAEMAQLRKELSIVREERDILKKALGIFSSQRK
jgi:transposase-like protein